MQKQADTQTESGILQTCMFIKTFKDARSCLVPFSYASSLADEKGVVKSAEQQACTGAAHYLRPLIVPCMSRLQEFASS